MLAGLVGSHSSCLAGLLQQELCPAVGARQAPEHTP